MAVLVLKNVPTEGPGSIGDYLEGVGIDYEVADLSLGQAPPPLEGFGSVVVLGGPMGVYEMDKYPHLGSCASIIEKAIGKGLRVLGVCLGAQLAAHVLGGRVYKGHAEELGWMDIELTEEGLLDPVAGALSGGNGTRGIKVLQWHGDTFDLPEGAVRLAGSELYPNQAFSYEGRVYALQFHMECTPEMVREWFEGRDDLEAIMQDTGRYMGDYALRAGGFYDRFFGCQTHAMKITKQQTIKEEGHDA